MKSSGKWRYAAALLCLGALALAGIVRWQVVRALNRSTQAVAAEQQLRFDLYPVTPAVTAGIESISTSLNFSQAAVFQGKLYVAGRI